MGEGVIINQTLPYTYDTALKFTSSITTSLPHHRPPGDCQLRFSINVDFARQINVIIFIHQYMVDNKEQTLINGTTWHAVLRRFAGTKFVPV